MNLTQRPQPNQYPAALTTLSAAAITPADRRLRAALSARQLFDVELGLFLLSQLLPTASPDHLPALLNGDTLTACAHWTARQRRTLSRGRTLLMSFRQPTRWHDLLDRYSRLTDQTQAFDISNDGSRFSPKTVGFFRNRVFTLRQLLA